MEGIGHVATLGRGPTLPRPAFLACGQLARLWITGWRDQEAAFVLVSELLEDEDEEVDDEPDDELDEPFDDEPDEDSPPPEPSEADPFDEEPARLSVR